VLVEGGAETAGDCALDADGERVAPAGVPPRLQAPAIAAAARTAAIAPGGEMNRGVPITDATPLCIGGYVSDAS
jgi:hypothetical protein